MAFVRTKDLMASRPDGSVGSCDCMPLWAIELPSGTLRRDRPHESAWGGDRPVSYVQLGAAFMGEFGRGRSHHRSVVDGTWWAESARPPSVLSGSSPVFNSSIVSDFSIASDSLSPADSSTWSGTAKRRDVRVEVVRLTGGNSYGT
jgi:hypothetical protein